MNGILQSQLDRIEAALNTLTESITSYNPSLPAVHELLAADDALTEGLDQLSRHQANYARILSLHNTSTALSTHLTTTLSTLAQTRSEILSAPASTFTSSQRPIPAADLLDYAKNLSRYTAPNGLQKRLAAQKPPDDPSTQQQPLADTSTQQDSTQTSLQQSTLPTTQPSTQPLTQDTNGTFPLSSASASNPILTPFHPAPSTNAPPDPPPDGIAISALTLPEVQWLDPLSHAPFTPWPSEETIRRGALAALQARAENGEDIERGKIEDVAAWETEDAAQDENAEAGKAGEEQAGEEQAGEEQAGEEQAGEEQAGEEQAGEDAMEGVVKAVGAGVGELDREKEWVVKVESNGQVNGEARREEVNGEAKREEVKRKPSVFAGLDLYDPDDE